MGEIELLSRRCRLSAGDLLALSREVAADDTVRGIVDLTPEQVSLLIGLLRLMASPIDVDDYHPAYAIAS
jgi:hypothetical protein